jgi:FtsP/CotA-like multicopper oxidase with cupredoxin domain
VRLLPLPQLAANGQPQDVSLTAGGSALLRAQALEAGTLSYQWQRLRAGRWSDITGATDVQLSLSPTQPTDSGLYRLLVQNARGSVYSREAAVAVRELDVIDPNGQPAPLVVVNPGNVAVFSVVAKGSDLSYQWRRNGTPIAGATSSV